jgi:hypothetical protein
MHEKKIEKGDLIQLLTSHAEIKEIYIYSDKRWEYTWQGCNQKECPMLDMNFFIEKKAGVVIYIPNKTIEDLK